VEQITSRFASASTGEPPVRVQICAACAADIDQIQRVYDVTLDYQRALKASVEAILSVMVPCLRARRR
jgi:hypothetical protein